MPFEQVSCPICGYWHSTAFWQRIASGVRPSTLAVLKQSLGRARGFKTVKSFEDYRFFYPDFVVIRTQIFDTLKIWLDKGFLSKWELKMAFSVLFREERVKTNLMVERTFPFLQLRENLFHKGKTEEVVL
ncbi:hypothetical protein ES703_51646 [subsurface metagenome]